MIDILCKVMYSGKVWQGEHLANLLFSNCWQKKVWQMNKSTKGLLIVTTTLDGVSLVNRRRFAKFTKLSTCQTFLLYGRYEYLKHVRRTSENFLQEKHEALLIVKLKRKN